MANFPVVEAIDIDLESRSILRVSIDQDWSASDFKNFFNSIEVLYTSKVLINSMFHAAGEFISDPKTKKIKFISFEQSPLAITISQIKELFEGHTLSTLEIGTRGYFINSTYRQPLLVKRITYSSPGFTDFLGLSGILKEIKEILMYYFPNRKDKEQCEILKQQKNELTIKNLKELGFSNIEIQTMLLREDVQFQKLANLIQSKQIKSIEVIDQTA